MGSAANAEEMACVPHFAPIDARNRAARIAEIFAGVPGDDGAWLLRYLDLPEASAATYKENLSPARQAFIDAYDAYIAGFFDVDISDAKDWHAGKATRFAINGGVDAEALEAIAATRTLAAPMQRMDAALRHAWMQWAGGVSEGIIDIDEVREGWRGRQIITRHTLDELNGVVSARARADIFASSAPHFGLYPDELSRLGKMLGLMDSMCGTAAPRTATNCNER